MSIAVLVVKEPYTRVLETAPKKALVVKEPQTRVLETGSKKALVATKIVTRVIKVGPNKVLVVKQTATRVIEVGRMGLQGIQGLPGVGILGQRELPIGVVNGVNTLFRTEFPYIAGTTRVYMNGLLQEEDFDYTESDPADNEFTFIDPPITGDRLQIVYGRE